MAKVVVPLAEGCEELEAVTIIDLLRRAGIEVVTVGLQDGPITASRGVRLLPDTGIDDVLSEDFDMMVLPGGLPGADNLERDDRVRSMLRRLNASDRYTAAICAAPKVLASAGLLEGRRATGYPGVLDALNLPGTRLLDQAVVRDGKVITSRGPGTAMDFALELIETLLGKEARDVVEAPLVRPV
jgi:4-methyl-5(b-hydroxyethyl)-thiazole monophosphate biosynthesis